MTNHITTTDRDGIRTVAMQRPEKKNALTQAMYRGMAEALRNANDDDAIRCVVFTGVTGAFSAGNDLEDFLKAVESGEGIVAAVSFLHALARSEKPLVAAVDGLAVGIGATMLFHCDQVVATPGSRFLAPFTQLGLVPEGGSSLLAPRQIGHKRAFSLLVMGRAMNATDAKETGLVSAVADDVEAEAMKIATEIAKLPPEAVRLSRNLLLSREETLARIDKEAEIFSQRMSSPEAVAAFKAFLSRKK